MKQSKGEDEPLAILAASTRRTGELEPLRNRRLTSLSEELEKRSVEESKAKHQERRNNI